MDKKEKTAKALGIVSFVLSILGLVCFFILNYSRQCLVIVSTPENH